VDAVYISSTNDKHVEQGLTALAAGRHVLCEKPLAVRLEDAVTLVSIAERAGVVLATNHHLRCSPVHRRLRELIAEGEVGDLLAVRVFHAVQLPARLRGWRVDSTALGSGVALDITVHDIDTVRFVTGLELETVTAVGASQGSHPGLIDAVMVAATLSGGVLLQTHDAFTVPHAPTGLEVHGSKGSLVSSQSMTQDPVGTVILHRAGEAHQVTLADSDDLYVRGLLRFADAVAGRGRPAASGVDGLRSLAAGLAVEQALRDGRSVSVPDVTHLVDASRAGPPSLDVTDRQNEKGNP
jgi:1,5-anhydro-D-fructose reductase (1,5-anhydro-D-mannitol-forming)